MWWASAGEQRLHSEEESEADSALLQGLALSLPTPITPRPRSQSTISIGIKGKAGAGPDMSANQEMAIIAYFHRLTTQILATLSDIVDAMDSDDEREDEHEALHRGQDGGLADETGPAVYVSSSDVARMGLDQWSSTDHAFIEDVAKEYFGRRAHVEGRNVDVCGIRIC
jgi:hypothetical protein